MTTTTPNFTKLLRPGLVDVGYGDTPKLRSVFVTVAYTDGRLSLSGVEGPTANGDALGSSGQCSDLAVVDYAPGWTAEMVDRLRAEWERWHLNDMRAGSPAQEAWLRANPVKATYPESHYDKASEALAAAGLNPDGGYRYGSAWLTEEVPADVLAWLQALPDSDRPMPGQWGR